MRLVQWMWANVGMARIAGLATVLLLLLQVAGCANQERLVVYADPWLSDYATQMTDAFQQTHPETEIQLKIISSEVIAQHVRYGQPVDVILCFGCEFLQQPDFRDKIEAQTALAATHIVKLSQANTAFAAKQAAMQTTASTMMEASDRPMRRYVEQAGFEHRIPQKDRIIANFQRQAADYLLRGWVPQGFVPENFKKMHPQQFVEIGRGPLIPNAFEAMLLANAPHKQLASEFFTLTSSEKSRKVLGELGFVP